MNLFQCLSAKERQSKNWKYKKKLIAICHIFLPQWCHIHFFKIIRVKEKTGHVSYFLRWLQFYVFRIKCNSTISISHCNSINLHYVMLFFHSIVPDLFFPFFILLFLRSHTLNFYLFLMMSFSQPSRIIFFVSFYIL